MSGKLKNILAIRQMLDGSHKSQTRKVFGGWDKKADSTIREVGDIWIEYDSNNDPICEWEQCKGYRIKRPYNMGKEFEENLIKSYSKCYQEKCKTSIKTRIDEKFNKISGMCEDCHLKVEDNLKAQGKFKEYERNKMLANAFDYFKDADVEFQKFLDYLKENPTYVNDNGTTEQWVRDGGNIDNIIENYINEYREYKDIVFKNLNNIGRI